MICLDEIGFSTALDRLYGYAPKGQRLVDFVPYGHWKTTTFLGGLTTRGFIAPMVLDGPMNGDAFKAYIEQVLTPECRPGDLVILDADPLQSARNYRRISVVIKDGKVVDLGALPAAPLISAKTKS